MRTREAISVELRAADIAWSMLHGEPCDMTVGELVGWMRCGDNRDRGNWPKSLAWQAGWLAAIIWAHEKEILMFDEKTTLQPVRARTRSPGHK